MATYLRAYILIFLRPINLRGRIIIWSTYINYHRHDELIKERFLFATAKIWICYFPPKYTMSPFFLWISPKKTLSDSWINILFFVCSVQLLFILCTTVANNFNMILIVTRHCLLLLPGYESNSVVTECVWLGRINNQTGGPSKKFKEMDGIYK
jgi:hypothetical protein